jgi:hypothetical protein
MEINKTCNSMSRFMIFVFLISSFVAAGQPPVPADLPAAKTMGFFLDDWQPKKFTIPDYQEVTTSPENHDTAYYQVTIDVSRVITRIPPSEFGHNANTWMTPMVNQPVFLRHVNNLQPHIIRFPAGSGSDLYFWNRRTGDLPPDVPPLLTDMNGTKKAPGFFFGKPASHFSASLDNYYEMLRLTGSSGLFTVNYGYARYGTGPNPVAAAAHLAADWVRYDHGRTHYWEIGNENNGNWEWGYRIDTTKNKDGQPEFLTGQLYARHFKVFADSMRKAAAETGSRIYIGAVTAEADALPFQTNLVRTWNAGMMKEINDYADFYVVHNYFTPYENNSDAATILRRAATVPSMMMNYVTRSLTDQGAALKPIAMDEWNMFAVHSRQQVSTVSGVFAVIVVGEALKNKYGLAARWDMLNGWAGGDDHGLFSAGDEPGVQGWSPRPSFYYLYFMQKMIGDRLLDARTRGDSSIRSYCSGFSSGEIGVTLVNTSGKARTVEIKTGAYPVGRRFYWYSLKGGSDNGDFSRKVFVNDHGTDAVAGGPSDYATLKAMSSLTAKGIRVEVPALGAVCLVIDRQ